MEQRGARNRRAEGAAFGGRHVNFLHLKYFLMVAEELNITRAAERLYISQQSLSNHISNMERELNVKLFTRSPKLALTYAGDLLVDTATQILDLHSQYLNKVGDINRHYMGVLRVGISYTCGLAVLPEILPQIRQLVGDRMKIFVDGGIRTGADIFKVLALGADAAMIGRPFVVAAHGGGAEGVRLYAESLGEQLKNVMLMPNCAALADITADKIRL